MKWWFPALAAAAFSQGGCGSSGNGSTASNADAGVDATTNVADGGDDTSNDGGVDAGLFESIFVVPPSLSSLSDVHFFDHPWPSDYRRDADGNIIVTGYYNPFAEPILIQYIQAVTGAINGFSIAAGGYLRFATDLDPTTLPATPP